MSRFNKLISLFKNGELSPKYFGRKDLEEYSTGAQIFENFIPAIESGFYNRGGSEFQADTELGVSNRGPALIKYIISKNEGFALVLNPDGNAAGWAKLYDNTGTQVTMSISVDSLENPAATLDPKGFVFSQSGAVLLLTHTSGLFRPMYLAPNLAGNFSFVDYQIGVVGIDATDVARVVKTPYRDTNISGTTITPSAISGTGITLTASFATFNVGHIGAFYKITHAGTTGIALIKTFTSNLIVTADVFINFGATTASTNWEESAWSLFRGYPRTVVHHEQRAIWGGNPSETDTLWCSRLGSIFHMMQRRMAQDFAGNTSGLNYFIPSGVPNEQAVYNGVGVQILEDDAFSFPPAVDEVNPISWMSSGRDLAVGTLGGEYIIGSEGRGFSILTVTVKSQTSYGGAPVKTVKNSNEVLFITRDGAKLRNFKYNDSNGTFLSGNLSVTADHIKRYGDGIFTEYEDTYEFLDMVVQPSEEIVWLLNNQNRLVGLRYSIENGNVAWFRTLFPDKDGDSNQVWGVTSIPSADGGADDLWIIVERTINSVKSFFLEKIAIRFDADSLIEEPFIDENLPAFLDSHVKIDNSGATITDTLTGLGHLEGEIVALTYRGERLSDYTVSGGEIALNSADEEKFDIAGIGFVGFVYVSNFESLDVEAGGDLGFSEGHTQRIERADVRFHNTRNAKAGSIERQDTLPFRFSSITSLFSGILQVQVPNSAGKDQRIKITNDQPQPCTVLSIALRGKTND